MSNLLDFSIPDTLSVIYLEILTPQIPVGGSVDFTFTLENSSDKPQKADIRYEICPHVTDGFSDCVRYPLSERICPRGYLLMNHSQTIGPGLNGIVTPGKYTLHIIVNHRRMKSAEFCVTPHFTSASTVTSPFSI